MQILPAIDLRDGKCVRLRQGDYNQETIFGQIPAAIKQAFADAGEVVPQPKTPTADPTTDSSNS